MEGELIMLQSRVSALCVVLVKKEKRTNKQTKTKKEEEKRYSNCKKIPRIKCLITADFKEEAEEQNCFLLALKFWVMFVAESYLDSLLVSGYLSSWFLYILVTPRDGA